MHPSLESNYEKSPFNVKSNPDWRWFCFSALCDWSGQLAPFSQPIRCKTRTNHDLSPAFFLRFQINKLIKLFLGIKSSYMRLFLIRSPYLVFFKCLEPSKRKKIHFFIRIRPSFREKPRKNKWSDTFFEAYKMVFNLQNLCLYSIYKYSIMQL